MAKKCASCGKTKPDGAFKSDDRFKDGMRKDCTACADGKEYALDVVDLHDVEIAAADVTVYGAGSPPGGDTYSVDDLRQIAEASNAVCEDLRPPVKIGHDRKQRLLRASGLWGEQPRTGTLKNFKVVGDKLVSDIIGMPKKLAELVPTAFRLRSMELGSARSQRNGGESYPTVVKGLALLGATTPAFQTLDDIHALYAGVDHEPTAELILKDSRLEDGDDALITNYAVGDVIWDEEDGVNDIMRDISDSLNPGMPDTMPRYWVMDLQLIDVDGDGDVPGPRALIGEYGNGAAWVVPITFDQEGEPQVPPSSDWVLAEQAWVQTQADADDAGGSGDTDMADRETRRPADTTGIVKVKVGDKTIELPDLDEGQVKAFGELFGLEGDDVTPEKVYAEMAARSEQPAPPAPPSPDPAPPAPAPPAPDDSGTRTFSQQEAAELVSRAERGDRAYEQLRVDRRDAYLHGLVKAGKLNPSELDEWRKDYDENETATRRLLDRLPIQDELVRVYGGDGDGLDFSDADESSYRAYCANQGIPYVGGRTAA